MSDASDTDASSTEPSDPTSGKQINKENQELQRASETVSGPPLRTPAKRGAEENQATFVLGCLTGERDQAAAAGDVTGDQELMLQTIQEMTNAFLLQQAKVVAQQEMGNDVTRMDDEALRRFGDGPELVRVKRTSMTVGHTKLDVDVVDLTKKILERITVHYKELSQLPQFHLMLERAGMASTTDIAERLTQSYHNTSKGALEPQRLELINWLT